MKTPIVADATAEMVALMTDRMHALEMRSDERDKDVVGLMEAFVQLGKLTKRTMEEARDTREAYVAQLTRMDAQDARMDALNNRMDAQVGYMDALMNRIDAVNLRVEPVEDDIGDLMEELHLLGRRTTRLENAARHRAMGLDRGVKPSRQPSVAEFFKPV